MITPDDAIAAIRGAGGAQPHCRALHAKGTLYRGTFTASPDAVRLSRAKHLGGSAVPALVRFSNGSGNPAQRDGLPGVRGMAVKFTLPDGKTTDVSAQTARLFVSSSPDGFIDLLKAMRPGLTTPLRMARYLVTHPRLFGALPVLRDANRVPASYAATEYHGLHAFRWVADDGSARFVRYHMVPAAPENYLSAKAAADEGPDFLTEELAARLADGPVRFDYRVQVAGPTDSTVDPSAPWQSTQFVTVGVVEITGPETGREHGGDIVVFDPMRVTDGIEPSDDPVLHFRTLAYSASVKLRTGVDRGSEAPPA
ncbi:catalase family peroxidase [Mycobacterium parmense]|uniref:Catalase-related peroxidase n=1 Tax=Mycobacterium parmense TaxID=185642 RepID=A0A7I7YSX5_9MYCO|nr:catalase family peroxidase [Mycobacterium parmense]MCV7351724.1 catalase family peroxidase [Mycobacterium parmense]ORW60175.1 catalase [Mycobacterium parmense]BBZ44809.1 catalase-related peroxidase [Mycobacterium parmense]